MISHPVLFICPFQFIVIGCHSTTQVAHGYSMIGCNEGGDESSDKILSYKNICWSDEGKLKLAEGNGYRLNNL